MIRKAIVEKKSNVQGGEGEIEFRHILSKAELLGHGRLFAEIRIPPGCSIGKHRHIEETEPYYILSGEGIFHDNEGKNHSVCAGDICTIAVGEEHWIENKSDNMLVLLALIYGEAGKQYE